MPYGLHRNGNALERVVLPFRTLTRLAQDEECQCTSSEARSRGGLGQMTATSVARLIEPPQKKEEKRSGPSLHGDQLNDKGAITGE
jgi:hypothetical protein